MTNDQPMIQVDRLSRRFGSFQAVDGISFEVGEGEIVGLLGPNGAGKTTTMRMLTTYLGPTSGRGRLAGFDVLDDPLEVRRRVGYLPENVPLYVEMRVREFLRFRARLKDVPRSKLRRAVAEVVGRCRLEEVENRIIGQLSRGFRQRVGLAEAMIHDPPILILDEPTAGLDPHPDPGGPGADPRPGGPAYNPAVHPHPSRSRGDLRTRHHHRRGKIAVDERLEDLRRGSAIEVEARGPAEAIRAALQTIPGVEQVVLSQQQGEHAGFQIQTQGDQDLREAISRKLHSNGWILRRLDLRRGSLEERFTQAVSQDTLADARREAS